ncbi:MAG: hypothetical protein AAGA54_26185 [Myxococcota bacterium]
MSQCDVDASESWALETRQRRRVVFEAALQRWNARERDVVFPAGTVRMRLRHKVKTEPIPALLRAA